MGNIKKIREDQHEAHARRRSHARRHFHVHAQFPRRAHHRRTGRHVVGERHRQDDPDPDDQDRQPRARGAARRPEWGHRRHALDAGSGQARPVVGRQSPKPPQGSEGNGRPHAGREVAVRSGAAGDAARDRPDADGARQIHRSLRRRRDAHRAPHGNVAGGRGRPRRRDPVAPRTPDLGWPGPGQQPVGPSTQRGRASRDPSQLPKRQLQDSPVFLYLKYSMPLQTPYLKLFWLIPNLSEKALHSKAILGLCRNLQEIILHQLEKAPLSLIRNEQEKKLSQIITHAKNSTELYQTLYKNIDTKIFSFQDLHHFPLVNKSIFLALKPRSIIANDIPQKRIVKGITSGSTGEPFRHFRDKKFNTTQKANLYRPWRWAGVDPNGPIVHCSAPHAAKNTPNTVFLHPHFIKSQIKNYAEKIRASGAKVLRGYPLTNFELAWNITKAGYSDISFTHAFFVGHALAEGVRRFFKEQFGCEVYQYYASEETGPIAAECELHEGMHIHEESIYIEILDEKNMPLNSGTGGKIVITSFLNDVMPLIRYDIGDIGKIIPEPCGCGKTSRRILVQGRKEDMILRPDGQSVYPGLVRDVLDEYFFAFERYQLSQISPSEILLRIVPTKNFSLTYVKKAISELTNCIEGTMKVSYELTQEIPPLPNGKYRYFVSPYWKAQYPEKLLEV